MRDGCTMPVIVPLTRKDIQRWTHAHRLLCKHVRMHTHTDTHTRTHIRTHTRTHTYAHTHARTHARTLTHTHTHTHIHTHTQAHTRTHARAHARTRSRTHARTYECVLIYYSFRKSLALSLLKWVTVFKIVVILRFCITRCWLYNISWLKRCWVTQEHQYKRSQITINGYIGHINVGIGMLWVD